MKILLEVVLAVSEMIKDGTLIYFKCKFVINVLECVICLICTYIYPSLSNCITTLYRHYRSKPSDVPFIYNRPTIYGS